MDLSRSRDDGSCKRLLMPNTPASDLLSGTSSKLNAFLKLLQLYLVTSSATTPLTTPSKTCLLHSTTPGPPLLPNSRKTRPQNKRLDTLDLFVENLNLFLEEYRERLGKWTKLGIHADEWHDKTITQCCEPCGWTIRCRGHRCSWA